MGQSKLENIKEKVAHMFSRGGEDPRKVVRTLMGAADQQLLINHRQCPHCQRSYDDDTLRAALFVCENCDHHFRITARTRFSILFDNETYEDISLAPSYKNPIDFPGYEKKTHDAQAQTGEDEAVSVAMGKIVEKKIVVACMSFAFMGGSMGTMVGERVLQALVTATRNKVPVLVITSSGGARMHEGLFSLMQMARTAHAAALLEQKRVPFFVLFTDPTTGGVTASFAMLGDVTIAEPGALIGFAGPRVIEGTIKHKLPEGFQSAEFQRKQGFVDAIVHRSNLRKVISYLIETHEIRG